MTADDSLLEFAREKLYAAAISDILDEEGLHDQALPPGIRPVDDQTVLCGRARTGLYMAINHDGGINVYEHEIALVDDLKPNDVVVLACGGSPRIAPWGELLSTAARARRAAGCVTDGLVRDVHRIRAMAFPVFSGGIGPLDTKHRGKMTLSDVPAKIGDTTIESGDVVFGDVDGVVVVPAGIADKVLSKAVTKVEGEDLVRRELEQGESLKVVFDKYGIL